MANLKDIRRKIKSVKNTQKTTRAMKLVSTAKLRRAEQVAKRSREYALKINEVLSDIAYKINQFKIGGIQGRFFEKNDNPSKVDILFITADKGLCGGFNVQTIKTVNALMQEYKEKNVKVRLRAVGKKGIEYYSFSGVDLLKKYEGVSSSPSYEKAQEIIKEAIDDFVEGVTDKIIIVHNGYKNMITQEIKRVDLTPVEIAVDEELKKASTSMMEVEPEDDESILNELIKKYFEYNMYYALIDSLAAEHSARMQAMDAATNNAKERVRQLTIQYNKARQESITTELIEIISGMEAMK
ncbi:MAG: F0F1 ATP synthase subunit gamma [Epsilonproteobacteria bacterium]|nr:F0F1 ATP synthase subunit gamma [Campylobacterota bacterium]